MIISIYSIINIMRDRFKRSVIMGGFYFFGLLALAFITGISLVAFGIKMIYKFVVK